MAEQRREAGRFFLVRHAPTASNVGKVFTGQLDVPALPVDDAEQWRVPHGGPRTIYTSPLSRARTTAKILFPGEVALVDERLSERAVGQWEGLDHATVQARWPGAFSDGVVDPFATPPGGETVDQLSQRVGDFLEMLVHGQGDGDLHVVTHNGWVRMAMLINGDITLGELFAKPVPFLRPLALELRPDRLRERHPIQSAG